MLEGDRQALRRDTFNHNVQPITDAVARLVAGEIRAGEAIQALLSRPLRPEGR